MTLIAEQEQIIIAYSFDHADKHLIGSFEYHWAIGTGLAAHSTNLKPPAFKTGQIPTERHPFLRRDRCRVEIYRLVG